MAMLVSHFSTDTAFLLLRRHQAVSVKLTFFGGGFDNVTLGNNYCYPHRERPFRPLPNISKYFIDSSANRRVWDISFLPHLSANSMKIGWQHEPGDVHY